MCDPCSNHERNFSNCEEKPENFRTSTGFEPVTLRCQCDVITSWALKPLILVAGRLWVQIFLWWMNQWRKWYMKWIIILYACIGLQMWSYDPRSYFQVSLCNNIARIAFITARIIASLDFISAVQYEGAFDWPYSGIRIRGVMIKTVSLARFEAARMVKMCLK